MLIIASSVQELIFHRDTMIYLLQNLGFILGLKLPGKDEEGGGHSQQGPSEPRQTNMGLSAVKKDHNYYRVSTWSSECDSRLGFPEFLGQERLETFPGSIHKNFSEIRDSQYYPLCILDLGSQETNTMY